MSESTVKGPQVRIRVNHTRTAKDGWKLSETTVEIDGELKFFDGRWFVGNPSADEPTIWSPVEAILADLSKEAFAAGEAEAQRRNNADRQTELHAAPTRERYVEDQF